MWCSCVPGGAQGPGLPLQKTRPQAASSGPRGAVLSESSVMLSRREHCELSELTGLHPQVGSQRPLGKAPARGLRSAIIGGAESPSLSRSVLPVPPPALRGRPRETFLKISLANYLFHWFYFHWFYFVFHKTLEYCSAKFFAITITFPPLPKTCSSFLYPPKKAFEGLCHP